MIIIVQSRISSTYFRYTMVILSRDPILMQELVISTYRPS